VRSWALPHLSVAALALGIAGCKERGEAHGTRPPGELASSVVDGGRGAANTTNDPAIVLLLKRALACKPTRGAIAGDCAGAIAWDASKEEFADGRADATLVNLLEDPDERVRILAVYKLDEAGKPYRTDARLAARIVDVAEQEQSTRVARPLGALVGRIDLERTQLFDRIELVARKHLLASMRGAIVEELLHENPASLQAFDLSKEMVRDPDAQVRASAVGAFWIGGVRWAAETCRLWFDNIDNTMDQDVAARAGELLTRYGRCQAYFDALLDSEEKRFRASRTDRAPFATALTNLCEDLRSTDAQRWRALVLARRMVEEKLTDTVVRGEALASVLACDPAGGRAFVNGFAGDKEQSVRERALSLLDPMRDK
jgi:hypothetical protein